MLGNTRLFFYKIIDLLVSDLRKFVKDLNIKTIDNFNVKKSFFLIF